MNVPGKTMLKVVSILYIVLGGIFALFMLLSLFLGAFIADMLSGYLGGLSALIGSLMFVVFLIPAAADLVFGIVGIKQCGNPSASLFFIIVGSILGVLALVGLIYSFSIISLLSLVMPILFIVGGFMNKNVQAVAPQA